MKLYWNDLSDTTQVSVWVSEYVHMKKIEEIEKWVALCETHLIEEELFQRGVLWDRNREFLGSEHLYLESAVYHIETYAGAEADFQGDRYTEEKVKCPQGSCSPYGEPFNVA